MTDPIKIATERFLLRPLTEHDVTERYLGWLRDSDAKKFIMAAARTEGLSDLKQYVCDRIGRDDVLFLGIFEKITDRHIGNIKYEPVNPEGGYAIMGVLIGDPAYRGKAVTSEILQASALWLKDHRNISQILLGVNKDNLAAVRAYEKAGFVVADTPHIKKSMPGAITMAWCLKKPRTVDSLSAF